MPARAAHCPVFLSLVSHRAERGVLLLLLALSLALVGCEDKADKWLPKAEATLEHLKPLVDRDTRQVREGLPKGAAKLAALVDDEPAAAPQGLRRAIKNTRSAVDDLAFAKSTFFSFVDAQGLVVRSEADPDLAAGHSLVKAIPEAQKMLDPKAGVVEVFGKMHELRGAEKGNDMQWVVGHPVTDGEGKLKGAFVTGWSFRGYAYTLEQHTRPHFVEIADDKGKVPLVYVFLVKGEEAFGAPVTPDVDAEAVGKLGIAAKLAAGGTFHQVIEVEKHPFLVVARPFPELGEGIAIALMLSVQ